MTNDGELTARLTHPRFHVPTIYDVRVKGRLTKADAHRYEAGVWLSEGKTGNSRVRIRKSGLQVTHVAVTLHEGRNREIRRAFEKLGFPVLSVKRIQIGPVVSRGLKLGQFRPLAADEVSALHEVAEGRAAATPPRRHRSPDAETTVPRSKRRPGKPDPALNPRPDTRPDKQRRGRRGNRMDARDSRKGGRTGSHKDPRSSGRRGGTSGGGKPGGGRTGGRPGHRGKPRR